MTDIEKRTNGDRVAPVVEAAKDSVKRWVRWVRDNPDEAAVAALPSVVLLLATSRHKLSFLEMEMVGQVGYWTGVLLLKEYRDWKTKPASPALRLWKVS